MNCIGNDKNHIAVPDSDDIACAREDADDAAALLDALSFAEISPTTKQQLTSLLRRKINSIRIAISG